MLAVWTIDREPPVDILEATPHPRRVRPGDPIRAHFELFRKRSCAGHQDRWITDSLNVRFELPDSDFRQSPEPIGNTTFGFLAHVSPFASPGPAHLYILFTYYCNPLHWIFPVELPRVIIPFEILPEKE